jgi:hypothetical protein
VAAGGDAVSVPQFTIGQRVTIEPMESIPARVISVILDAEGWTIEVRYFHNGEAKTLKCFADEVEAMQ